MFDRITEEDAARSRRAWEARKGAAGTSPAASIASAKLQKIIDDHLRKYPNGTPKIEYKPGALVHEAEKLAEAIRRARQ